MMPLINDAGCSERNRLQEDWRWYVTAEEWSSEAGEVLPAISGSYQGWGTAILCIN